MYTKYYLYNIVFAFLLLINKICLKRGNLSKKEVRTKKNL